MFGKPKSFLGVDLGAGGLKIVELKLEKNRPVLFTYGLTSEKQDIHRLMARSELKQSPGAFKAETNAQAQKIEDQKLSDEQIEKYANHIKTVCKSAKTVSKSAVVSLPVSSVFHAVVTLPIVSKKEELDHLVKSEVKKLLSIPLEEVALDYQILKGSENDKIQRVLLNAVPHTLISFYTKIFQKAGLILESLEPESTAITRCLIGKDTSVSLIVDIGAERTSFFIIDNGVPVSHRSIESGGNKLDRILQNILGVDIGLIEEAKYDLFDHLNEEGSDILTAQKFLDTFMPILDPIIKEIDISLELFLRQSGNENKRPEKIILTGGMGLIPYLTKTISDKFKIRCYVGDPWSRIIYQDGLKPILHKIGPRMSVAVGLALKNVI